MNWTLRRLLPALGVTALLMGTVSSGPAQAADEPERPTTEQRLVALEERMTVDQRRAVEEFQVWIASRGKAQLSGETAEGRRVGKLGGEGLQTMVTRKNADGTFSTRCVDSPEQYALFLLGELDGSGAQGVRQATE